MKYTPYKALFGNISTTPRRRRKYFKSYMIKPSFYKKPKIPKKQRENINEISNPKFKRYIKRTRNYKAMYQDWDGDKVINKYDCQPTNRWKQGSNSIDERNFGKASRELESVQKLIYSLRMEDITRVKNGEQPRNGSMLENLNLRENILRTTVNRYEKLLGVSNREEIAKTQENVSKRKKEDQFFWKGMTEEEKRNANERYEKIRQAKKEDMMFDLKKFDMWSKHNEKIQGMKINPEKYKEFALTKGILRNKAKSTEMKFDIKNPLKYLKDLEKRRNVDKNYKRFIKLIDKYKQLGLSPNDAIFRAKLKLEEEIKEELNTKSTLKPRDWSNVKLKGGRIKLL